MHSTLQNALVALEFSRGFTMAVLSAIPDDKFLHQPFPGANHALWVTGHVACVDAWLLKACGGPADPRLETIAAKFSMHSQVSPQAAEYPPLAEVRQWFQESRQTLLDWYRPQDEQQLQTPLPEGLQQIAVNRLALIFRLAVHESAHAGQLTVVRKSLGLQPVFA